MEAKVDRLVPKTMGFDSPKAQKSGRVNSRCSNALRTTRSTLAPKAFQRCLHTVEICLGILELPPLGQEKLDKIISFEAQQNVPFPLDEVVWDYQIVGGGMGEEIQVVLVAIKVDLLDEINAEVEGTGLQTSIVDIAPMALYN